MDANTHPLDQLEAELLRDRRVVVERLIRASTRVRQLTPEVRAANEELQEAVARARSLGIGNAADFYLKRAS